MNTPTLASEDWPSSLGGDIEEAIIAKSSISPRQSLRNNEEVADALHSKTRGFNQFKQYTHPPHDYFSHFVSPNLAKY
jgi:hypothetical protein